MNSGSEKKAAKWNAFNRINATLGSIKTALAGTYRNVSAHQPGLEYTKRYIASFGSRFNCCYRFDTMAERLMYEEL